jgi:hypothetical protein
MAVDSWIYELAISSCNKNNLRTGGIYLCISVHNGQMHLQGGMRFLRKDVTRYRTTFPMTHICYVLLLVTCSSSLQLLCKISNMYVIGLYKMYLNTFYRDLTFSG